MNRLLAVIVLVGCSHPDWSELRSESGRFRAEMPGAPIVGTHQTVTVPTTTEVHTFLVERGARGRFQISYYDLSMPLTGDMIQNAEQIDCLSTAGAKLIVSTEHPVQLGAVPGYAVTLTSPISDTLPDGGYEQDECFVVSQRMYHLIAVGPNTADEQRDATRFLGSFQLL